MSWVVTTELGRMWRHADNSTADNEHPVTARLYGLGAASLFELAARRWALDTRPVIPGRLDVAGSVQSEANRPLPPTARASAVGTRPSARRESCLATAKQTNGHELEFEATHGATRGQVKLDAGLLKTTRTLG